jgi:hydrogenase/urease accessory protein HupE
VIVSDNIQVQHTSKRKLNGYNIDKKVTITDDIVNLNIQFNQLEEQGMKVFVRFTPLEGDSITNIIQASDPTFKLATGSKNNFNSYYFLQGIKHILIGLDHLLFLLLIIMLVRRIRPLIISITLFTVAHSITLALVATGWLKVPTLPVEAIIALSIIFLAKEVIESKHKMADTHLFITIFTFGLLHGLGFASALLDIGMSNDNLLFNLFFFNVGVEVGQILFLVSTIYFYKLLSSKFHQLKHDNANKIISYMIGIVSSFWLAQRVILLIT